MKNISRVGNCMMIKIHAVSEDVKFFWHGSIGFSKQSENVYSKKQMDVMATSDLKSLF